jgi:hypothetical protein
MPQISNFIQYSHLFPDQLFPVWRTLKYLKNPFVLIGQVAVANGVRIASSFLCVDSTAQLKRSFDRWNIQFLTVDAPPCDDIA